MTTIAATFDGGTAELSDAAIGQLSAALRGALILDGDARFDEARRVWNGNVDRRPADDRPEKVRASYGENFGRLRALKAAYDPLNLFRQNANIAPR